jgi:subtilisin family serine protease/photosystem II stability/assembly factor-like uncharacterized protein
MKNVLLFLVAFIALVSITQSSPRDFQNVQLESNKNLYEIEIPSKTINSRYIPAKKVGIQVLNDEFLEQNIIEIKTRNYEHFNASTSQFLNPQMNSMLSFLTIKSIKSPYNEYFKGDDLMSRDKVGLSRIYQIRYANDINPYQICKQLIENAEIEYATPVFKRNTYGFVPNDAWYQIGYHLAKINMPDAWEVTKGDTNVFIAIVDSGTDINHEDLKGNIWNNPNEIPNNGKDDDKNGKIDDIHGWDMIGGITAAQLNNGSFKEDADPTNMIVSHGTHTAGCASAMTNNTIGVAAPGFFCKILPVKCASDAFNSPGISRGYEGILYAAATGAKIISCSWGGPGWSPVEEDIINQAISLGAVVLVASGNSAKNIDVDPDYPAAFKGVLCVGSSGNTDRASSFTSYGNAVRVYAPGDNIWSTLPGNKYEAQSGTSMATPVVAGVVALLMSIHKDWTPDQIIHHIRGTSDNVLSTTNPSLRPYYFGRINAAKALQFNNLPDKKIAGISLEDLKVDNGNNTISSFENNPVKITLKNHLAPDNNIKVRLIPVDNFIEFDKASYDIGAMNNFEVKNITAQVKLLSNNPWYKGTADVIVEITGTDYVNFELAKINIQVPSNNRLSQYSTVNSGYGIVWHSSSFLGDDMIYIVGASQFTQVGGVILKANRSGSSMMQVNTTGVYCMHAFNENNLLAADGPTNGLASIYSSTNAGVNWTKKPINNITGFVNSINFFNNFQGILLGDPKGTTWGVASTNDAGNTWELMQSLPPAIASETGLVGSVLQKGETIWFGTTAGRIFRTNDKGNTWSVSTVASGGVVSSIAFSDSIGACLYSPTNTQGANRLLAITKDGGKTWTNSIYNFTTNNQIPLTVYAVEDTKTIVVQLYSGVVIASDNEGLGWYPVLSEEKSEYTYAIGNQVGNKVSMYAAGSDITRLEYSFAPSVIKKSISIVGGNLALFDSVAVNSSKDMVIELKNIGNTPVDISEISLVADNGTEQNEFRVLLPSPKSVSPTTPSQLRLRFSPKSSGIKTARINIKSDAENPSINLDLIGYGSASTSVDDLQDFGNIKIIPNPSSESVMISTNEEIKFNNVKIIDLMGNEIININGFSSNSRIDVSAIPVGVYYILMNSEKGTVQRKISVIR